MNETPPEDQTSYLAMSERLVAIVERLRGVTIDGKPIVPPGDLAFLSMLCSELGGLDLSMQSMMYQSLAVAREGVQDRKRADWLQANNADLLNRCRDGEAALDLVTKLAEAAGVNFEEIE